MSLNIALILPVFVIAGLVIAGIVLVNGWKQTGHGLLDTRVAIILKLMSLSGKDIFAEGNTPTQVREASTKGQGLIKGPPTPIDRIEQKTIPGPGGPIQMRIYTPVEQPNLPIILYFHGGGWVIGSLDSHDNLCRSLAQKTSAVLISVDYRLAPEHAFPAAFDDAYAALHWVSEQAATLSGDASRIFVLGDSAGGNLAAAISLMARDQKGPAIRGQILIYPVTNAASLETESYKHFADGYFLTHRYMDIFRTMYLPQAQDRLNIYASPLLADDLTNLPPAMVITAEFDVLRDEGEAYAQKLKAAGVPTHPIRYQGMIHGFLGMDRLLKQFDQATDDIARYIKELT